MIRMQRAGGDADEDKQKMDEEVKMARMVTLQNVVAFGFFCGLIRAAPWILKQF
ncbi:unnamed protein product [Lymnaea stagnalis]|uniref:Mitochondrial import receptor subunit TOM5 homolog n=1 Tax=Lymnaea stagnalis TaxID=6523 RepID=A0AAV2I255_LYMST